MVRKTSKKHKSGAPVGNKKTLRQKLSEPLHLNVFLKKRQNIENNIQKYKQLYDSETQKAEPLNVKTYRERM